MQGFACPLAAPYASTQALVRRASYQSPEVDCSISLPPQTVTGAGRLAWLDASGPTGDVNHAWPCAAICCWVSALPGTAAVRLLLVPTTRISGGELTLPGFVS